MQQIFVFGCGQLFSVKQGALLKTYEIAGIYDNYKTGEYQLEDGRIVPVIKPAKDNTGGYSVAIMRTDVAEAWEQLRDLGVKAESVIFPYEIQPLYENEIDLFSHGERLEIQGNNMIYRDRWENVYPVCHRKDFDELMKVQERKAVNSKTILEGCPGEPLNRTFGFSRGTPVDRYYIEKFLNDEKMNIRGDVWEVAENTYTMRYGAENVRNSFMLHVSSDEPGYTKGNFETGEGIKSEVADCIILTQVLPFISDCKAAVSNIYRMLKPGGVCLITVSGISQISRYDMDRWGHYWGFTDLSLRTLLEEQVPEEQIKIRVFGNVKSATALLYGIAAEELDQEELDNTDADYQVSICAVIRKEEK